LYLKLYFKVGVVSEHEEWYTSKRGQVVMKTTVGWKQTVQELKDAYNKLAIELDDIPCILIVEPFVSMHFKKEGMLNT